MYIFGIHQTIYAVLISQRISENFENITFLPIIYKIMSKNPKNLSKSEKKGAEEKSNPNTFH